VLAGLLWLPVTRNWSPRAHLCWASSTYLFAVYLVYALEWTFASRLGPASTAGGVLLWCLEVVAALMSCAYLWELCDALGTAHWHRRRARLDPRQRIPTAALRAVGPAHQRKRVLSSGAGGGCGGWGWRLRDLWYCCGRGRGAGGGPARGHADGPRRVVLLRAGAWLPVCPVSSRPYVAQAGSAVRAACPDSVQPGWREGPGTGEGCPGWLTGSWCRQRRCGLALPVRGGDGLAGCRRSGRSRESPVRRLPAALRRAGGRLMRLRGPSPRRGRP
jgi:hypothetical protein